MSGIIAILHEDGRPVDEETLWSLTNYMRYRGPDEQQIWRHGHVGLGHALFRTTDEMVHERQPMTLDGEVWITADARIDDRSTLRRKLENNGRILEEPVTDVAYILHAYAVWGEECVHHLMGDFAFVIWDERDQRLFGARDHFGVKPFFYTHQSGLLLISNTLNCLRTHPLVSSELDHDVINSFLARGYNEYPDRSAFIDIRRLSPAHSFSWSENETHTNNYWVIPIEEPLRYRRVNDYVEEFLGTLSVAVKDRMRFNEIAVAMSGGLDSTTIAALAQQFSSSRGGAIRAFTGVIRGPEGDNERRLTRMTADHLGIEIEFYETEDLVPLAQWSNTTWNSPEPSLRLKSRRGMELYSVIPKFSRVLLTGYGGDPILFPSQSYLISIAKKGRIFQLISDIRQYYLYRHRIPPIYIRSAMARAKGRWLGHFTNKDTRAISNPNSGSNDQITIPAEKAQEHPWRQEAVDRLDTTWWATLFEGYDAGGTGFLSEARHPFFDIRLVKFALRLPSVPWCVQKEVMRQAMGDFLPQAITNRPKMSLSGNMNQHEIISGIDKNWAEQLLEVRDVGDYVEEELAIQNLLRYINGEVVPGSDSEKLWYPFILAYWMKNNDTYIRYDPFGRLLNEHQ